MKLNNKIAGHLTINDISYPIEMLVIKDFNDGTDFEIDTVDGRRIDGQSYADVTYGDDNESFTSLDDLLDYISTQAEAGGGSAGSQGPKGDKGDKGDTGDTGPAGTYTFDTTPTSGSTNPVTSGGIYTAIQASTTTAKANSITNSLIFG